MNLTETEIAKLKATKSRTEWNKVCDEIKNARGGKYPPDWFPRIIMSGLRSQIENSWQSSLDN